MRTKYDNEHMTHIFNFALSCNLFKTGEGEKCS